MIRLLIVLLALVPYAAAGGPRWVTGPPYFNNSGFPVIWYTDQPKYFTDPGDLSPYVDHNAADAIVAAASSVWNVTTSRLVLTRGGALDEHVSGANVYASTNGLVFPSDVQATNYLAKQIAVIYDRDGSVTDLLLGSGASDPSICRQNAVTESVDSIARDGYIHHAILVLNGRCTGPAPEQQLQLQYQLMRAFGRIVGLGWSQVNDNVFTGNPRPTYDQALNWPIMHPIDVICGPYTYQCMPQPFTLRADDISSLDTLYLVDWSHVIPGKELTWDESNRVVGAVTFPSGQGMQGVNVVVQRLQPFWGTPEAWETASAVSGYLFRREGANPVTGAGSSLKASMGTTDPTLEGRYDIMRVPIPASEPWQNLVVSIQPINPLYIGAYAVGPYDSNGVAPSGTATVQEPTVLGRESYTEIDFPATSSADSCSTSGDGSEAAPGAIATTGWWTANLCNYGHTAWSSLTVKGGRTLTVEVSAQDENGFVTTAKAMPVIGLWNATDSLGSLPGLAAAGTAFNSLVAGMTTLTAHNSQQQQLRIAIADQRGDGRPDFAYQARVLYADTITPATVPAVGGVVTITGTGFRAGNAVTINGVNATVSSWSANQIVATVPSLHLLRSSTALVTDVAVTDITTGGSSVMTGALSYAAPVPILSLLTGPSGTVPVGQSIVTPFAVRVMAADNVTPVVNEAITFTAAGGSVQFAACGASTCTIATDANGVASTLVTPTSPGSITLHATGIDGAATASFNAVTRVQTLTLQRPLQYVAAGTTFISTLLVTATDNLAPTQGTVVSWQAKAGAINLSPTNSVVDSQGNTQTAATIGPLPPGSQATASACAWTTICTTFTAIGVDPAEWRLEVVSGAGQSLHAADTFAPVVLRVTDIAAHPIAGATVQIHQTIEPWTMPCPDSGRCPIAPVYNSSLNSVITDADGLITVIPLEAAGAAEITNLAAATGTQGFLALALQKQP
jgi:hypothetical protein